VNTLVAPGMVWDFRCHARCNRRYTSSDSLNQTYWDMREAGWLVCLSEGGYEERVYCPAHSEEAPDPDTEGSFFQVECDSCDLEIECFTEEDAEEEVRYHEDEHDCDCCWHHCTIYTADEVAERRARWKLYEAESSLRREQVDAYNQYIDFLVRRDQDNRRRDMELQDSPTPILRWELRHKAEMAVVITLAVFIALMLLSGCGAGKYTEKYKDAQRGATNSSPADTGTMPDGFSNFASKCDHGNRVYTLFHEDGAYGSLAVVPNAEGC